MRYWVVITVLMQETLSGEVVSLTDPAEGGGVIGPRPGLIKYKNNQNLRVLGIISASLAVSNISNGAEIIFDK